MTTGEPVRLLDDESASSALRRDLARAVSVGAAGYSAAEGLARLEAALAGGAGAPSTPPAATGAAKAWWILGGGGAAVMAVLVAWSVGWSARSEAPPVPPAAAATATPAPVEAPATRVAADRPIPSLDISLDGPFTHPSQLGVGPAAPTAPRPPLPAAASPRDPDALRAEVAQLTRIRSLLSGNPAAALAGAAEGDRAFPRGQLHQEREVVAIDALRALGRTDEAAQRARAFVQAFPSGPYSERMRAVAANAP